MSLSKSTEMALQYLLFEDIRYFLTLNLLNNENNLIMPLREN
jgi:hypothetical protein